MIIADLEAIKAREAAATPGPWEVNGSPHDRHIATIGRHYITTPNKEGRSAHNDEEAAFIAHAREDLPALLEAVERLLSMLRDAETEAQMQTSYADQLRAVAREMAVALADNGHDPGDDEGCVGCAALAAYVDAVGPLSAEEEDG